MAHKAQREFCDSVRVKYPEMFKNKKVKGVFVGPSIQKLYEMLVQVANSF